MKDYIKEKLKRKAVDLEALQKYFKIIEYFEKNPIKHTYFQFHHILPVFVLKDELDLKNRGYTIDILDEDYPPEDNIIKLDTQYHVIAHYYLAKAMKTRDAENAFRIFDDWTKEFNEYSEKEAIQLGLDVKECSQPNSQIEYKTNKQKEQEKLDERYNKRKKKLNKINITLEDQ